MNNYSKAWYALYTRSKHEKVIQNYLKQRNIFSFLPMVTEIRQWSDRKKSVIVPLFPNYLFVHLASNEFWRMNDVPGAVALVGIRNKPSQIPDNVIESLQKVMTENIEVGELSLIPGEIVKITDGRFIGVVGKFIRKGSRDMLAIEIEIMNRVVLLEITSSDIQKMEPANNKTHALAS